MTISPELRRLSDATNDAWDAAKRGFWSPEKTRAYNLAARAEKRYAQGQREAKA